MGDFEVGDFVIVYAPPDSERDEFNAGWNLAMQQHDGNIGEIVGTGTGNDGNQDYKIRFDNGDHWWWDIKYMEALSGSQLSSVTDEEFNSVLEV